MVLEPVSRLALRRGELLLYATSGRDRLPAQEKIRIWYRIARACGENCQDVALEREDSLQSTCRDRTVERRLKVVEY
jgi:hypothetical protein